MNRHDSYRTVTSTYFFCGKQTPVSPFLTTCQNPLSKKSSALIFFHFFFLREYKTDFFPLFFFLYMDRWLSTIKPFLVPSFHIISAANQCYTCCFDYFFLHGTKRHARGETKGPITQNRLSAYWLHSPVFSGFTTCNRGPVGSNIS